MIIYSLTCTGTSFEIFKNFFWYYLIAIMAFTFIGIIFFQNRKGQDREMTLTGAPWPRSLQPYARNPTQRVPPAAPPSVPIAMQPPCQSRRSGFGSWPMKTAVAALAVTRAQSKGQQGPARRSTIANFDHPFCVYVLRPPNCSTSQFIATRNSSKPPDSHCASGTFFHLRPK